MKDEIIKPDSYMYSQWEVALIEANSNLAPLEPDEVMYTQSAVEIPFQLKRLYMYIRQERLKLLKKEMKRMKGN